MPHYRYHLSEFPEPQATVKHISLIFEVGEAETKVFAETKFVCRINQLEDLKLNAKNLEIQHVSEIIEEQDEKSEKEISYTYENDFLTIHLNESLMQGSHVTIKTVTVCKPTENILEGLYYDVTPRGSPRTQITQCQQWGFQRIAPCIDDMRAKSTWTIKIIADKRYTNLIASGNAVSKRESYDETRDTITYENSEPMPPYLFFLGVGTWDTFSREFEYPDGKKIQLELLALKGSEEKAALASLDILSDSILWTYLFTGPERDENIDVRQEIYALCLLRDKLSKTVSLKEKDAALQPIRDEIAKLNEKLVNGYQYPFEVYREIAMQNSDFGGMENTGNTTIIASRIMPSPEITDASYEYMIGVKQHEFYHNLNGSSVTGDTPFSIWLNEAVTVMVEDDYLAFLFGEKYIRLKNLLQMYAPGIGTFALDTGAAAMPIEPEGFNDPNDLITAVTYVKAPEFVRMIRFVLGKRAFSWALDLYHQRFMDKNASPRDWLNAMEDIGREDFTTMAGRWLKQTGYPMVNANARYIPEENAAEITVEQTGFGKQSPWIFPFTGRLVTDKGVTVAKFVKKMDAAKLTFQVPCAGAFSFCSWNEEHAAYIRLITDATDDELYLQLQFVDDVSGQFLAFQQLMDREMEKLCRDESYVPSKRLVTEYLRILFDADFMEECGSLPLTIFEFCSNSEFSYAYTKLWNAKQRFLKAAAKSAEHQLFMMLLIYNPETKVETPAELAKVFKVRQVKNLALTLLASLDTPDVHECVKQQYHEAVNATDRLTALSLYLSGSAKDRMEFLDNELSRAYSAGPVAWENFLSAVSSGSSLDTVSYLRQIESSGKFHVEQAGEARSLYLRFAQNRKLSLETESGRAFLKESLLLMAGVNEYITTNMLGVFSHLSFYESSVQRFCIDTLNELIETVPKEKAPAVISTATRILEMSAAEIGRGR